MKRKCFLFIFLALIIFQDCKKVDENIYPDSIKEICITSEISVDNGVSIHNPNLNLIAYEDFLKYLITSNRFMIVTQRDFPNVTSNDKVIISLRYDIDDNINAAVKFAYRESKYGIKSTYFILHTANYYGVTKLDYFLRNDNIVYYLKKIQDSYGQEIGWHNDLVTLQVVYNLDPKLYLATELQWLRGNGINVYGTVAHGREFCYQYNYVNSYFWNHTECSIGGVSYNCEYIQKDEVLIKIEKDDLSNYDLEYDANQFIADYFFADVFRVNGKMWHMGMVNFDTIQPGKKVIILLHPQYWD